MPCPDDTHALFALFVKVHDLETLQTKYLPGFVKSLKQNGEELAYLVTATAIDEAPFAEPDTKTGFHKCVLVGAKSIEDLNKWHDSADYQAIVSFRLDSTTGPAAAGVTLF